MKKKKDDVTSNCYTVPLNGWTEVFNGLLSNMLYIFEIKAAVNMLNPAVWCCVMSWEKKQKQNNNAILLCVNESDAKIIHWEEIICHCSSIWSRVRSDCQADCLQDKKDPNRKSF